MFLAGKDAGCSEPRGGPLPLCRTVHCFGQELGHACRIPPVAQTFKSKSFSRFQFRRWEGACGVRRRVGPSGKALAFPGTENLQPIAQMKRAPGVSGLVWAQASLPATGAALAYGSGLCACRGGRSAFAIFTPGHLKLGLCVRPLLSSPAHGGAWASASDWVRAGSLSPRRRMARSLRGIRGPWLGFGPVVPRLPQASFTGSAYFGPWASPSARPSAGAGPGASASA